MTTLKTPSEWFAAGRIKATHLQPYFSAAVMGLVPYQVPGFGTLGVTKRGVLMWDPELFTKWSVENLAWVLLHEAGHYLRDHAGRREACAAEPTLWNLAGDAEINDDLTAAGARFPVFTKEDTDDKSKLGQATGVHPKDLNCEDGKLCEEYYASLRKNAKIIKVGVVTLPGGGPGGKGKKGKSKGDAEGDGDGSGEKTLSTQVGVGKGGCGSGSGADPSPEEADVPASLGKSPAEQKRIQREVAEAVRTAAQRGRGTVPAGLQRWAEEVLGPPHVPWQQKLARVCRAAIAYRPGAGDYRYDKPSRRQGAFGYGTGAPVFPALRMPIPHVAVIFDTSGSMGPDALRTGLEEVKGILSAVGAHVDMFACDADVHAAVKVRSVTEAAQALKGGGGTDMQPAFAAIASMSRRPEVIVCITDGAIGDPGPKPKAHVIWVVCGPYQVTDTLVWGDVVQVDHVPGKDEED